ncbi:MAG TPA: heparan-alpha-glucosaminide N-acetyltransferase domain-containing protein [Chitinophagaceae bacterium]|nr:heparan-alpha-glucosaminide N-acetyltransferase domain-containing protein [Chitinophagaceae bacterium]
MNQRFYSLDVFRGATVCLMILVNNPGSWSHIYPPLEHASWHGLTPTDLVFPFFLFAVGNALSFVMPRLQAGGDGVFWKKVIVRSLLIYLIGLFLTWWPFVRWTNDHLAFRPWVDPKNPESGVRILGVLARIAICYFFASIIIYYSKPRGAFYIGLLLLLLYWALCFLLGDYSMTGWFGNKVDRAVLGVAHMYKGEGIPFDPEGIMSTMTAIVEVIFGYLVGDYIQKKGKNYEMLSGLFVAGVALILTGFCWDMVFPINKKIWTSSYTVYTTGLATITIATMIYLIEFKNVRGWVARFFDVFGKNALFVFALSAFLPKTLALIRIPDHLNTEGKMVYVNPWNWLYQKVLVNIPGDPRIGSLLYAICVIILMWAICYWMDKKKIYVKV